MTEQISREEAIVDLTQRRRLLEEQTVLLDISRDLAVYDICIGALRALPAINGEGAAQSARIAQLERQLRDFHASQHYRYIGKDGKPVLARDLECRAEKLRDDLNATISEGMELVIDRNYWKGRAEKAEDLYQRDCLGLNNEGDPIGGDPPIGWKLRAEKAEADLAGEYQRAEDQAALVKCACAYEKPTDICEGHKRIFDRINAARAAGGDMIRRAEAQRAFAKAYRFCGSIREIEAAAEDNDAFMRAWAALEAIPAAPAPQKGEGNTPDFWLVEGLVFETEAEAQYAARCGGLGVDRIQPVRCIPATAQKGEPIDFTHKPFGRIKPECATEGCGEPSLDHIIVGGIGSDYCFECADKVIAAHKGGWK